MDIAQITTVVAAVAAALANVYLALSDSSRTGARTRELDLLGEQLKTMKKMFDSQAAQSRSLIKQLGQLVEIMARETV